MLKQWDSQKNRKLLQHNKIMKCIYDSLMQKVEQSEQTNQKIQKQFKDQLQQLQQNQKQHKKMIKLEQCFSQSGQKLIELGKEVDHQNSQFVKKQQEFMMFIDKGIIQVLQQEHSSYNKIVSRMNEQIEILKKRQQNILNMNMETSSKFTRLFYDMVVNNKQNGDLYLEKLQFMRLQKELVQVHRQLGSQLVYLWEQMTKLEFTRMGLYQRLLVEFISKRDRHQLKTNNILELIEHEFGIKQIIPANEYSMIQEILENKDPLKFQQVKDYLVGFKVEWMQDDPLIVEIVQLQRDVGSFTSNYQTYNALFTVDYRILFVKVQNEQQESYAMPDLSIQQNMCKFTVKQSHNNKIQAELIEQVPGYLYSSKKKLNLRFTSQQQLQQFQKHF